MQNYKIIGYTIGAQVMRPLFFYRKEHLFFSFEIGSAIIHLIEALCNIKGGNHGSIR